MTISCYNEQSDLSLSSSQVENLIAQVLAFKKIRFDEVSCYFVSVEAISSLHNDFFADPSPTDCISFPIDDPASTPEEYCVLGEVFVCPKVALSYASLHQLDPYRETSLYVIHGLLHLIGYRDSSVKEKTKMREEEKTCLCYLEEKRALLTS